MAQGKRGGGRSEEEGGMRDEERGSGYRWLPGNADSEMSPASCDRFALRCVACVALRALRASLGANKRYSSNTIFASSPFLSFPAFPSFLPPLLTNTTELDCRRYFPLYSLSTAITKMSAWIAVVCIFIDYILSFD